jgi:hypothetical protein
LVSKVASKYYQGYTLLGAHVEIPRNAVVGVIDSVRNKALRFVLEIEEQEPSAGEVQPGTKPAQQIQTGDLAGLKRFLAEHGVEAGDLDELESAISKDPTPKPEEPLGKRVTGWTAKMLSKAASGAWNVGSSAAGDILAAAVKAYYGLS